MTRKSHLTPDEIDELARFEDEMKDRANMARWSDEQWEAYEEESTPPSWACMRDPTSDRYAEY